MSNCVKKGWKMEFFEALFPIDERVLNVPYALKKPSNREQYLDKIIPDRKKTDLNLAFKLLEENIPKWLYKYRSVSEYSLDNLENDTIWVDNPKNYNDPFDSISTDDVRALKFMEQMNKAPLLNEYKYELLNSLDDEEKKKMDRIFEVFSNHAQSTFKVACLSETKTSVLMWSHYADEHKGFCIEYSGPEIYYCDDVNKHLFPVKYIQKNEKQIPVSAMALDYPGLYSVLCKTRDWKYEKEWRICFGIEYGLEPRNIILPKAKSIYLGKRITDENKNKIMNIASRKKIPVYQEMLDIEERKIRFQKI